MNPAGKMNKKPTAFQKIPPHDVLVTHHLPAGPPEPSDPGRKLRRANKATALIPMLLRSNKENIQTARPCVCVSARESGWKEVGEGSMSEAGILVK